MDEHFLAAAPVRHVGTFDVPRSAPEVWLELTRDGALDHARLLGGARWTSPRPFGVGTTRVMPVCFGALVVEETFFRWEEGRRKSFYAHAMSLPGFRRFAEDYLVEPMGERACRFTWTLAGEPQRGALHQPLLTAVLARSMFADTRRHFGAG